MLEATIHGKQNELWIGGDTYTHREELKGLGGEWNGSKWVFKADSKSAAMEIMEGIVAIDGDALLNGCLDKDGNTARIADVLVKH